MKEKLLSLQSSGESVEKALAIHYTSLFSNEAFYSNYDVSIFFGHNLPKKDSNLNVHGTVGFYAQYLSDLPYIPYCSKQYFWDNKNDILELLCMKGVITERNWNRLNSDDNLFWLFIRNIPFEFIYPDYYNKLIVESCKQLNIANLRSLYLEKSWSQMIFNIKNDFFRYSIYALEKDGHIGKYTTDGKNYIDLVRNLNRASVMSGNSAMLLKEIGFRIGNKTIVGYRKHSRNIRYNRNYELGNLLKEHSSLIEPSNVFLGREFDNALSFSSEEEKTNYVYAKVFREYLEKNHTCLKI